MQTWRKKEGSDRKSDISQRKKVIVSGAKSSWCVYTSIVETRRINKMNTAAAFLTAVLAAGSVLGAGSVTSQPFGKTPDGKEVSLYTLKNSKGMEARIMTYGGTVVSLKVPDRSGALGDVVLGYDTLGDYIKASPYFGCLVGRYGNRIAKGKFSLNGAQYTLATNNNENHLHGGIKGFDKVIWSATILKDKPDATLELKYVSPDGEEGYPGALSVTAVYSVTDKNELRLDYTASTDKPTVCNLTHHSYFNLAGKGDILNHAVKISADAFTPVDSTLIPTGELKPVEGTPFDFRKATTIGARIKAEDQQLKFGLGYDHNWAFKKPVGKLTSMARVQEPTTGRIMEVLSTEPGLQFYSGNFLDGTNVGKGGIAYQFRNGFCMEPQHYPDSPNKSQFPSVTLNPGQAYHNTIVYRFSVAKK
jgi:aldose 1-epimerase